MEKTDSEKHAALPALPSAEISLNGDVLMGPTYTYGDQRGCIEGGQQHAVSKHQKKAHTEGDLGNTQASSHTGKSLYLSS